MAQPLDYQEPHGAGAGHLFPFWHSTDGRIANLDVSYNTQHPYLSQSHGLGNVSSISQGGNPYDNGCFASSASGGIVPASYVSYAQEAIQEISRPPRSRWLTVHGRDRKLVLDLPPVQESQNFIARLSSPPGRFYWHLGPCDPWSPLMNGTSAPSSSQSDDPITPQTAFSSDSPDHYSGNDLPSRHISISNIIECLPAPMKTVHESWSGEEQEQVLANTLEALGTDIKSVYLSDPMSWRNLLKPLCGPNGILCSMERNGPQGGITSIKCSQCSKKFDRRNHIELFAHHLITEHWRIHPFRCSRCTYRADRRHDRKRHQETPHDMSEELV